MNSCVHTATLAGALSLAPLALVGQDPTGQPQLDRSKPVPTKSEVIAAWQKRQDAMTTFEFVWSEQQNHPTGWLPNPRFTERERLAIPVLLVDRTYSVIKSLAVDGIRMRYSFEIDRREEAEGLGVRRHYAYASVFDGQLGEAGLTSLTESPPAAIRRVGTSLDAQNLDTRAILMAFRPLDGTMGHLLLDRAVTNQVRTFYKGRSTFLLEERHDPSGWKTVLWIEPERDFLVTRLAVLFEQKWIVDIDIDYRQDQRWGWVPSGWRVTQMLANGARRLVSSATVSSYKINVPIGIRTLQ